MIQGVDTSFLVAVEVASHGRHGDSRMLRDRLLQGGDQFAIVPQVLAEFVHIVTDPRRCANPLSIDVAINRAESVWNAQETIQVFPDSAATSQFFIWMRQHQLGRKRLLDTILAATFHAVSIKSVVTLNRSDFELFGYFTIHEP